MVRSSKDGAGARTESPGEVGHPEPGTDASEVAYVRRLVEAAPPLTRRQREKLRAILRETERR